MYKKVQEINLLFGKALIGYLNKSMQLGHFISHIGISQLIFKHSRQYAVSESSFTGLAFPFWTNKVNTRSKSKYLDIIEYTEFILDGYFIEMKCNMNDKFIYLKFNNYAQIRSIWAYINYNYNEYFKENIVKIRF